jgi:exopolysaccharide production protein ExoZ
MRKLAALQILRGIAASLVVIDHSILRHGEWHDYPEIVEVAAQYSGTLGVAVFFVISGYIMIHTAGDQFGQPGAALLFLRKRIVRIVPLYWLATALEVALRLRKGGAIDPQQLLTSLFFIPQPVAAGDYMRPLLGVGWTLNYEMSFYCIFAATLIFRRTVGLTLLFSALVGLVALGTLYKPLDDTSPPHTLLGFWTDPIILLFAAGVAIGLATGAMQRLRTNVRAVMVSCLLLLAYAAVFLLAEGTYPIPLAWQAGGWAICAMAVALCVAGRQGKATLGGMFGSKLGDLSYALYLYHFFAIVAAEKAWWFVFGKNPSLLFVGVAYFVSVAAAYAIHHLIETNAARLLAPRAAPPAAAIRDADTAGLPTIPRQRATAPHR